MPSAASVMSGEWAATLTGSTIGPLGAELLGDLGAGLDGGALAGHDDLAGGVPVGDDERAVRGGRGEELGQAGVVEADERGHRAVAALAGRLHQLAATTDEADAVLERQDAGRDERRVLAHRMAGGEGRGRGLETGGRPALAERLEDRDRGREQRRLGVLGEVEAIGRTVPGEPADRFEPRAASAAPQAAAAAGDDAARSRPMPTDWEPWPGKTKAIEDIAARVRGRVAVTANSRACLHA